MTEEKPSEEIKIDIFKSKYVPISRILSEDEKKALLEKYNISSVQLPKISHSDAVVRALKGKGGDVIEFVRKAKTAGLSKYYRIVVGGSA
ncbi:MAG: DNA-directed RNA polymerase subunit H [Candidatus Nanoarchaeia archaeon]|nr:DNA-directed RNA polymerase subunit H [Candidatus Nanoarchaeia archaeon]MDD5238871.1 DNA-directed RNA polymerase subunit H [Candidatus Nanoarchaeia archaeon]